MRFTLSTSSHLQSDSLVPFLPVNESKHQLQGLPASVSYSPIHQVPPPSQDNVTSANTKLTEPSPASAHFWTWGCGNSLDSFLIRRVCDRLGAYYITVLKSENSNLNHETQTQFPAGACGFFWKTHRLQPGIEFVFHG